MAGNSGNFNFFNYGKDTADSTPGSSFLNKFAQDMQKTSASGNQISENITNNVEIYQQPEIDNMPRMETFGTLPEGAPLTLCTVRDPNSDTVNFNSSVNINGDSYFSDLTPEQIQALSYTDL